MAQIRQSKPYSGLCVQIKILKLFQLDPSRPFASPLSKSWALPVRVVAVEREYVDSLSFAMHGLDCLIYAMLTVLFVP